ncbi:DNA-3-methyladenine glycosylase I [Vibrio sinaloensis]|uniref:DNA-3-methyladenine glycosylase I n=1 Tax=Photobacterium sp. (strain ATCC 43367) TaxID=379097 RepID=UPI0022AF2D84|nr:DNA-3-methyladenine glycosylase I [Vibrio sinaloensis]MCZ4295110.1 DNA-3-methyladenine glycosylase I [Vibrio sinaloensis]
MARCKWVDSSKLDYVEYHDTEWGIPVYDDRVFFEFLILESAQAGLSWYTILKRREGYRKAFAEFEPTIVADFDANKIESLMGDCSIIRNRAKIEAAINNARCFLNVQHKYGSFSNFIWSYVDGKPLDRRTIEDMPPATTTLSDTIAKDLKKLGFKFLGSTTVYAFLQATGIVNDHDLGCFCRSTRN